MKPLPRHRWQSGGAGSPLRRARRHCPPQRLPARSLRMRRSRLLATGKQRRGPPLRDRPRAARRARPRRVRGLLQPGPPGRPGGSGLSAARLWWIAAAAPEGRRAEGAGTARAESCGAASAGSAEITRFVCRRVTRYGPRAANGKAGGGGGAALGGRRLLRVRCPARCLASWRAVSVTRVPHVCGLSKVGSQS